MVDAPKNAKRVEVRAPMSGVFYRQPDPEDPPYVEIGEGCRIHRAIVDRGAVFPPGSEVGIDHEADKANGYRVTESGLTLVTPDMLGQQLHFTR